MIRSTILAIFFLILLTRFAHGDIAFVANVGGNWDLFTVDQNGRNLVQQTKTPYDEKQPSCTSCREKIVYASSDGYLNIIEVKDKISRPISILNQPVSGMTPALSPDNEKVAFVQYSQQVGDDTDLHIFNLLTSKTRRALAQNGIQMWPTWSPDGTRLIYANSHCSLECGRYIQELWIADPQGGWARQLLMTNAFCQQPDWSPDGQKIAFSSDQAGHFDIWILYLNDLHLEQITNDKSLDEHPVWSPDGNKLAFISMRSGLMEIWIKDFENDKLMPLKPFGDKNIACKDVTW